MLAKYLDIISSTGEGFLPHLRLVVSDIQDLFCSDANNMIVNPQTKVLTPCVRVLCPEGESL